ncbi:MAG: phage major capsid protein [Streptococcaceae bacterium]|jgi:HK97 family phage major capsid protein|nr:phage major capsid protein [Streptococcaceae bacterium]
MNKIQELMEKRAQAWNGAKAFVEAKQDEDGLMSDEDAKTYAEMETKVTNFTKEIERLQGMAAMERELSKPTSEPLTSQPMTENKAEIKTGRGSSDYKTAVLNALRSNFKHVSNILQEGVDTAGGYLVPEEYDSRLIQGLTEENIMRKLGTSITTSGEHKINIAATTPAASWIEEGGALSFGDATFDQILLDAHKLHVAIKITDELLYDNAFNLESYILDQFAKALANAEEDAFLNGTGTGRPTGIFAATGGGQVAVTTANKAAITTDEIIDLIYALNRPYRKNAAFILNDATIALLRKLKDSNGAYLWQPSVQAGEPDRLLGYPVYTSAFAPVVEAGKPAIAFGDFSYYNIGDRGVRSFDQLRELFAGNGMVGFLAKERVDGKLILPEAVQILKMKAAA